MGDRIEIKAKLGPFIFIWLVALGFLVIAFWSNDALVKMDKPVSIRGEALYHLDQTLIGLNIPPGMIFAIPTIMIFMLFYRSLTVFIGGYKLVIGNDGIMEMNHGLILWEDIEDIKAVTAEMCLRITKEWEKVTWIAIFLYEPEKHINKISSLRFLLRLAAKEGLHTIGTPVRFNISLLKCEPEELLAILQRELYKRKSGIKTMSSDTYSETTTPTAIPATVLPSFDLQIINSGQTLSGVITRLSRRHIFQIELTEPCELSVCVTNDGGEGLPNWESYVNVIDANGSEISASGRFEFPYNSTMEIENAGTYDIEIKSSRTGAYCLTVQY